MAVTIIDVAKKAGVAVGTVSRYLNGYQLREKNRIKVERAIEELEFNINLMARGLKSHRSMTIAVVIPRYTATFEMSITAVMERILEQENYSLVLCNFEDDSEKLKKKLMFVRGRFIDGLILFPFNKGTESIDILHNYLADDIPVVLIDHPIFGVETDTILVDNANASFRAVEQLILEHHTKIAIINGRKDSYVSQERLRGYYDAMQTYNLKINEDWVTWGEYNRIGAYTATKALCTASDPPTAIYVTGFYMTIGTVMALHELHLHIPEDISLIGFDHFEPSDAIEPALTMVDQPIERIGQCAVELILKRINGEYADFPQQIKLNTKMILGDSVRTI